ncbi:MAG TPA: nucleotidyltransferase family protein [Gammaproteobacteria bacterium]|nr:nucleotidyltransferase family protein [Gammaproteobacteria bacterium]
MRKHRSAALEVRRLLTAVLRDPALLHRLPESELDLTLRIARRARLLGYLCAYLERNGSLHELSETVRDQLTSAQTLAEAHARAALWELDRLALALSDEALPRLIVLKGCAYALAELPNAAGRSFADLDLLLSRSDLHRAESRLLANGWAFTKLAPYDQHYYRAWTHELPPLVHRERQVEVDLHHNILPLTARLKPNAALLLKAARPIPGTRYLRLSDEDLVLHAMAHLCFDGDMSGSLRDLVDIDLLLRHFAKHEDEFWMRLVGRARTLDLARPAFYALRFAYRLLGTPVPDEVWCPSEASGPSRLSRKRRPSPLIGRTMDALVVSALFPEHPDEPSRAPALAKFCLYLRSHWIRMPPLLLARHLGYKLYVAHIKPRLSALPLGGWRKARSREA